MTLDVPTGTPDRGPGIVALSAVLIVLVTTAVIARVASKFVVKQYWWWDDYIALFSLPIQLTLLGMVLAWRDVGLGLHSDVIATINPLLLLQNARRLYIAIFFFGCSISFPKLSALCFYARVFPPSNRIFRINLWIAGILVVGWISSAILTAVFQCTPIARAWNPTIPGHCIDDYVWYLSTASISLVTDVYILLLPVPMIWALKTSLRRRIYLLCAFFLAYSVIVLSAGRLIVTIKLIPSVAEDLTWSFPVYLYWACLEGSVSLISICVPNIIGLIKALARPTRSPISEESNRPYKDAQIVNPRISKGPLVDTRSQPLRNDDGDGFERLVNSDRLAFWATTVNGQSYEMPSDGPENSDTAISLSNIHVQTHISVVDGTNDHARKHFHAV